MVARMALSAAFEPGNEVVGQLVAELGAAGAAEFLASREHTARGQAALARRWRRRTGLRRQTLSLNWLTVGALRSSFRVSHMADTTR